MRRREFLQGGFLKLARSFREGAEGMGGERFHPPYLRPPGAIEEEDFLELCIPSCELCSQACPHGAIKRAPEGSRLRAGTPVIDPGETPCYLCPELPCIEACPAGALLPQPREEVRMGRARVFRERCLSWQRHEFDCSYCFDRCPLKGRAIRMAPRGGPVVDGDRCAGCGVCQYICVTKPPSIMVEPR